jgi:uncharacterized tellurite resistance protein B-like protein
LSPSSSQLKSSGINTSGSSALSAVEEASSVIPEQVAENPMIGILNQDQSKSNVAPVSPSEWRIWADKLTEQGFGQLHMETLSKKHQIWWPVTRARELLGSYLKKDLPELESLPGFGEKKLNSLVGIVRRTISELQGPSSALPSEEASPPGAQDAGSPPTPEQLSNPVAFVTPVQWREWADRLREDDCQDLQMGPLAAEHKQWWPANKSTELLGKYLDLDLHEIVDLPNFGDRRLTALLGIVRGTVAGLQVPSEDDEPVVDRIEQRWQPGDPPCPFVWQQLVCAARERQLSDLVLGEEALRLDLKWPDKRHDETVGLYLELSLSELLQRRGFGTQKASRLMAILFSLLKNPPRAITSDTSVPADPFSPNDTLQDRLRALISTLPPRDQTILHRRYGFDCESEQTLEEVGVVLKRTRERVRQLENRALKTLRAKSEDYKLLQRFGEELRGSWSAISDGYGVLHPNALGVVQRHWGGTLSLLLAILGQKIEDALDRLLLRVGEGWYRGPLSNEDLLLTEMLLSGQLTSGQSPHRLPLPVDTVASLINRPSLEILVAGRLSRSVDQIDGYITKNKPTAGNRRAIRIHRVMKECTRKQPFMTLAEVVAAFPEAQREKSDLSRNIESSMKANSQLFLSMGVKQWRVLENDFNLAEEANANGLPSADPLERVVSSGGLAGAIENFLAKNGPQRLVDICNWVDVQKADGYSRSSVAPTLMRSEFIRMAPGLYGLPEHLLDPGALESARDLLLTPRACREFLRARFSGDAAETFVLWDTAMEVKWLHWADDSLKENLLYVCEPSRWVDLPESVIEQYQEEKQQARYTLDSSMEASSTELPALRDLVVALVHASFSATVGWVEVNQATRRRNDNSNGVLVLKYLVALGAVKSTTDPRIAHPSTDRARDLAQQATRFLHLGGDLEWGSKMGEQILQELEGNEGVPEDSWVDSEEIASRASAEIFRHNHTSRVSLQPEHVECLLTLGRTIASADGRIDQTELGRIDTLLKDHRSETLEDGNQTSLERVKAIEDSGCALKVARALTAQTTVGQRLAILRELFNIALADGVYEDAEDEVLENLADALEIPKSAHYQLQEQARSQERRQETREDVTDDVGTGTHSSTKPTQPTHVDQLLSHIFGGE